MLSTESDTEPDIDESNITFRTPTTASQPDHPPQLERNTTTTTIDTTTIVDLSREYRTLEPEDILPQPDNHENMEMEMESDSDDGHEFCKDCVCNHFHFSVTNQPYNRHYDCPTCRANVKKVRVNYSKLDAKNKLELLDNDVLTYDIQLYCRNASCMIDDELIGEE